MEYEQRGELRLEGATFKREGKASVVTLSNPRYLNAEDESTLPGAEIAVDVALLDPKTEVCVLRGDVVTHAKYAGRRLFGAGINLTHLYEGKIRYLWYLIRDLGFVNKLYRGLAQENQSPELASTEKLWIAAVEGFAIGGHCQILLTMDYTLAAQDAYLTLPARKEGIIPGAANLRLPRFVGDRIARQAILAERRIECSSPEGRMICDDIVPSSKMDDAIASMVEKLTSSGVVSAAKPACVPRRRRTARYVPPVYGNLRARAGRLPFQPGPNSRILKGTGKTDEDSRAARAQPQPARPARAAHLRQYDARRHQPETGATGQGVGCRAGNSAVEP